MRIERIMLAVSDIEASIEFWTEKIGLELSSRAGVFAFVDGGDVELVLHEVADRPRDESLTELVLEVEDVRSSYDQLSGRGVPFEVEPRAVTSDGTRELWAAHFYDPDGHLASLTGWV